MLIFILFACSVDGSVDVSDGISDEALLVILLLARQAEEFRDIATARSKISIRF
jgi:hypothetical protein